MDRGAWWTRVHGVAKIQTQLSDETATAVSTWIWVSCPYHTSVARTPPSSDPALLSPRPGPRVANPWTQHLCSHSQAHPRTPSGEEGPGVEPGTPSTSLRPAVRCQVFALLPELLSTSEFTCFLQKMRLVLGQGPLYSIQGGLLHLSEPGVVILRESKVLESLSKPFKGIHAYSLGMSL